MKLWIWLAMLPAAAVAQENQAARGAEVYRTSCAVPYCHGAEGRPARAPGLAGRGLSTAAIVNTVTTGIPNTGMPGFGRRLPSADISAVASYIMSLGPKDGAGGTLKASPPVPAAVAHGRTLFFDATRTGNCGACHEVGGWGGSVSLALQDLRRARLGDLRSPETPEVFTAKPTGEDPFPAVVVEKTAARVRVYDLSSRIPVLRSFAAADVTLTSSTSWRHADSAALYSGAELEEIGRYLKWAAEQQ
jgi:mono/diheme cytochrome c family protein